MKFTAEFIEDEFTEESREMGIYKIIPLGSDEIKPILEAGKLEDAKIACEEILTLISISTTHALNTLVDVCNSMGDFEGEEKYLHLLLKEEAEGGDPYSLSRITNRLAEIQDLDCLAYSLFEGEEEE